MAARTICLQAVKNLVFQLLYTAHLVDINAHIPNTITDKTIITFLNQLRNQKSLSNSIMKKYVQENNLTLLIYVHMINIVKWDQLMYNIIIYLTLISSSFSPLYFDVDIFRSHTGNLAHFIEPNVCVRLKQFLFYVLVLKHTLCLFGTNKFYVTHLHAYDQYSKIE
jgi:hypothetical protein